MKTLLIVTAALEAVTGLVLSLSPSLVVSLLLGTSLDTPGGLVVARVAGAALLALGLACWLARGAGTALVGAMLLYNAAVVGVLLHARISLGLNGIGIWPAVALHAGLAGWCLACLQRRPSPTTTN